MPARSVVIDKLSKWNGETHADVTPGEYTQLTGRAGRRGIDVEGHAVVLWAPGFDPKAVAGLASTRTYPLRSSFRPSYNMAVNLVRQFGRETARELLESSFAQFQADRAVVGLARQVRKAEEALAGYADAIACDRGDFMEYAAAAPGPVRPRGVAVRSGASPTAATLPRESLDTLRIGDVIEVPAGRWSGIAVVIDPGMRSQREGPRPLVRHRRPAGPAAVDGRLPDAGRAADPDADREDVQRAQPAAAPRPGRSCCATARATCRDRRHARARRTRSVARAGRPRGRTAARRRSASHPCHDCPDREDHARWAERYVKLERETAALRRRIEQRTNTIARQFDRVCEVLEELDYLRRRRR